MKTPVRQLVVQMRRRGLGQSDVAAALGVTQGHLSKVIAGRVPVSDRLDREIRSFLSSLDREPIGSTELSTLVDHAIRESADFRTLVRSALRMVNKNS